MSASQLRVAVNPLPWIFGSDFSWNMDEAVIRHALADLRSVGFGAVHAEVPADMSTADYRKMLEDNGFHAAPGYFGANFDLIDERSEVLDGAGRAAAVQAELGLTEIFIANHLSPQRQATPAIGAAFDADRLSGVCDGLIAAAAAMKREGVSAALHPHVGSWIETDSEVRAVLDASAGSDLAFGPDTGHLFWAGIDPGAIIADYADRVVAIHLKDVDSVVRRTTIEAGSDYGTATFGQHVWTEPGRGAIDFDAVFGALPADFSGWCVIEVDVPNIGDRIQSAQASFDWALSRPELARVPAGAAR